MGLRGAHVPASVLAEQRRLMGLRGAHAHAQHTHPEASPPPSLESPTAAATATEGAATAPAAAPAAHLARAPAEAPVKAPAKAASSKSVTKLPSDHVAVLQSAIKAIDKHFSQADLAGSSYTEEVLGDDNKNKDIAVLVRGQLCTALSKVLLHGFKAYKLIGRYHIWDFVQESTNATEKRLNGASPSDAEKTLLAAVLQVNSHEGMANNPNIKFRSFVCCGLNARLLNEWMAVLTVDRETMAKFYEPWAFIQEKTDSLPQLMTTLTPLGTHKYSLSLDYELEKWDLH